MKVTKDKKLPLFRRKEQKRYLARGKKGCNICGRVLDVKYFRKQSRGPHRENDYKSHCKYCVHVNISKVVLTEEDFYHKMETDDKYGRNNIKRIMRIVGADFKTAKNHVDEPKECEICGKTEEEEGRRMALDHDHLTGKVRGALCFDCNSTLGKFNDNIMLLRKAADYLEKYEHETAN